MRILRASLGCGVLAASTAALMLGSSAAARPHVIVWGSSLTGTPRKLAHPAFRFDAEFWNTSLAGNAHARAPRAGTIAAIKLKTGNDSAAVAIRISVIRRGANGTFKVVTTSTPTWTLPAHSPGIHTFSTSQLRFKMPVRKGDLVVLDTPGVKPGASVWFARRSGSTTQLFAGPGPTQNQGATWHGQAHPGVELLLQIVERPG
jgi:hypothetical protein